MTTALSIRRQRREAAPVPRLTVAQLAVATPPELVAYEQALRLELALSSPLHYAAHTSPWFEPLPHLQLLDRLIVDLISDRLRHPETGKVVRRLAVSMPPQHGKSTVISEHTPPWFLSRFPDWRVALATYEADFSASWGRKCRALIDANPEFGISLSKDSRAADKWDLAAPNRGGMVTTGIGGPLTGKPAHLLIIDDPVKNAKEAASPTFQKDHWDWLITTAKTRLQPISYMILLQTRWNEADLLGQAIEKQGDRWYYINLPALAMEDDPLGREPGEALAPTWFDRPALLERQSDEEDGQWFSALYQGSPTVAGGGIFKEANFRSWSRTTDHYKLHAPTGEVSYVSIKDCTRIQTVDLAATVKTRSDFSVISTFDVTPERELILIDRVRVRIESSEHRDWMAEHYSRMKPRYAIVEAKTYGLTLLQGAYKDGMTLRPGNEGNEDKVARAIPAGRAVDKGRVYFPQADTAPWISEWTHELTQFPNGAHDDQVDTLAMAVEEVTTGALSTPVRKKEPEDQSLEARLARYTDRQSRKKRGRHPILGRM